MSKFPYIDPSAQIAEAVSIHPTVVIGANAKIGRGCTLAPYSIVGAHTTLGEENHIYSFAVVGAKAQDKKELGQTEHELICGHGNQFREGVTISKGTSYARKTIVGDENFWMAHSHLGHDSVVGSQCVFANGVSIAGHADIGNQVHFGGHSAIHQFTKIGRLAFIAANAMVSQDVPPFCLVAGDHAKIRGLNIIGLRRAGVSAENRLLLKRVYFQLLRKTMLHYSTDALDNTEAAELKAFIENNKLSARGICAVYQRAVE